MLKSNLIALFLAGNSLIFSMASSSKAATNLEDVLPAEDEQITIGNQADTQSSNEATGLQSDSQSDSQADLLNDLQGDANQRLSDGITKVKRRTRRSRAQVLRDATDGSDESAQSTSNSESRLPDFLKTPLQTTSCAKFVDQNGKLGTYGKYVVQYFKKHKKDSDFALLADLPGSDTPFEVPSYTIERETVNGRTHRHKVFAGNQSFGGICPLWDEFSEKEKIRFWIWTLSSIASAESGCVWNALNIHGSNDAAIGLFQLDQDYTYRGMHKGQECQVRGTERLRTPHGGMYNFSRVVEPKYNTGCSLSMLNQFILAGSGEGQFAKASITRSVSIDGVRKSTKIPIGNGLLYSSQKNRVITYWHDLFAPFGGQIGKDMRKFSPCFNKSDLQILKEQGL